MNDSRRAQKSRRRAPSGTLRCCAAEALESRRLLSAAPATTALPSGVNATANAGLSPQQVRLAYGFDTPTSAAAHQGDGTGQTIAIVDAYNDPNLAADIQTFDTRFGLPDPPSLQVINQSGGSQLPATNALWARESSLDTQWAHAIAPDASLLVVEANSSKFSDLLAAEDVARNYTGVTVVSLSWGTAEFASETSFDSYFTTPQNHLPVTFVAASGDQGQGHVQWPAVSPNVLSVGGTTLATQAPADPEPQPDTQWSASSGGFSTYEPAPEYQSNLTGLTSRAVPDVALNANPANGYAIFDSTPYAGNSGWQVVGGTSAATPQWAALVAIADQTRCANGEPSLNGAADALPALYSLAGTPALTPVAATAQGDSQPLYTTTAGLGTPNAQVLIANLSNATISPKEHHHVLHGGTPGAPVPIPGPSTTPAVAPTVTPSLIPATPASPTPVLVKSVPIIAPFNLQSPDPLPSAGASDAAARGDLLTSSKRLTGSVPITSARLATAPGSPLSARPLTHLFSTVPVEITHLSEPIGAVAFQAVQAAISALSRFVSPATANALPPIAPPPAAPGAPRTLVNLFHINASASFADAMNALIDESATVAVTPPTSHLRAWIVTTLVAGADLALFIYWYTGRRPQSQKPPRRNLAWPTEMADPPPFPTPEP